jgi:pyridinium-3,5-bisthiocarboxylic acid mononucleotide nickel chelatase
MQTAYFDTICGASGDMILSALLDAGAPLEKLQEDLGRLPIPGLSVNVEKVKRHGMAASHMVLAWDTPNEYRHLHDILAIIEQGGFAPRVVERSRAVLSRLAEAEAAVHGTSVHHVHFHEIGAVDTIVDIAGVALCLDYLGVEEIRFATLTDGHGTVKTAHGEMPVPVPATAKLIAGLRMRGLDVEGELLTPTGAAVLTTLGSQCAHVPEGVVRAIGVGCGDKDVHGHANVLRVFLLDTGTISGAPARVCVLESDMDHVSGEVMGFTAEECLRAGALDVSWAPVFMKKGRPAYRLTVVCEVTAREPLTALVMKHTRTLGVRWIEMQRTVAAREAVGAAIDGQAVAAKRCGAGSEAFVKPEFEDVARLAREQGRSILDVYEAFGRNAAK